MTWGNESKDREKGRKKERNTYIFIGEKECLRKEWGINGVLRSKTRAEHL
jgi:hypothetical protein